MCFPLTVSLLEIIPINGDQNPTPLQGSTREVRPCVPTRIFPGLQLKPMVDNLHP